MKYVGILTGALLASAVFATQAQAATFLTEASYIAANTTTNNVTFGGIAAPGTVARPGSPFNIGNLSITSGSNAVASSSFFFGTPRDTFFVDLFSAPATFTFNAPVTAFGANIANGFDGGSIIASIFNGSNLLGNFTFNVADQRAFTGFFGVNDLGPITSFTLSPGNGGFLLVDQVRSGQAAMGAVPEPNTWAMMLTGFGFIGGTMRYRRRKTKVVYATV